MRTTSSSRHQFDKAALPHLRDLYAIAMRMTRNPDAAQDLVQETYLRAYGAWSRFAEDSNCRAWLIRILTNSYINHYRRARSHRSFTQRSEDEKLQALYGEATRPAVRSAEATLCSFTFSDEVDRALGELDDDYRLVILLADVEEMRYKDIAAALGWPIGTVMSRLFRARRKLEEKLAPSARTDYGIGRAAAA
jgi:RNA polymerase sigma-70 factor, ECF subfamily